MTQISEPWREAYVAYWMEGYADGKADRNFDLVSERSINAIADCESTQWASRTGYLVGWMAGEVARFRGPSQEG